MVLRKNIRRFPTTMMAGMRHLLLRWAISSSDAVVAERLGTREMTVPTRNKAMAVMVAVVEERDQAITPRETATITVSRAILKPCHKQGP